MMHALVNQICMSKGLGRLRRQLPLVLASLRKAAGDQGVDIVGIGHYDPFVTQSSRTFAAASVGAVEQLDRTLLAIYGRFGIPMANVSRAFEMTSTQAVMVGGRSEPEDVARACQLTWMCARHPYGPNLHPNDAGYRVIAQTISQLLPSLPSATVGPTP
jgi:lysophospholipase L1-like esterase